MIHCGISKNPACDCRTDPQTDNHVITECPFIVHQVVSMAWLMSRNMQQFHLWVATQQFILVSHTRRIMWLIVVFSFTLWNEFVEIRGGYSVQKTLRGCAANMDRKSASWYMNLAYELANFSKFPKLSQNWLKFKKILEKSDDFAQILAPKMGRLVYEWVTFS